MLIRSLPLLEAQYTWITDFFPVLHNLIRKRGFFLFRLFNHFCYISIFYIYRYRQYFTPLYFLIPHRHMQKSEQHLNCPLKSLKYFLLYTWNTHFEILERILLDLKSNWGINKIVSANDNKINEELTCNNNNNTVRKTCSKWPPPFYKRTSPIT